MDLFTFIMEYRGGTYISQVLGKTLHDAKNKWVANLAMNEIKHFGIAMKEELLDLIVQNHLHAKGG